MTARIQRKGRPARPHNRISRQTIKMEPDVRNFLIMYGREVDRPMSYLINNIVRLHSKSASVPASQLRLDPGGAPAVGRIGVDASC